MKRFKKSESQQRQIVKEVTRQLNELDFYCDFLNGEPLFPATNDLLLSDSLSSIEQENPPSSSIPTVDPPTILKFTCSSATSRSESGGASDVANEDGYVGQMTEDNFEFLADEDEIAEDCDFEGYDVEYLEPLESDSESDEEELTGDRSKIFQASLKQLAIEYQPTQSFLRGLLALLNKHTNLQLPKDPRTLLGTPKPKQFVKVGTGEYAEFDWVPSLNERLSKLINSSAVIVDFSVDGVPIFKGSSIQFWVTSSRICTTGLKTAVFLAGIYCGNGKPSSVTEYLTPFVNQVKQLTSANSNLEFKLRLICDLPARSFVLGSIGHTGYHSCGKCYIPGTYYERRMVFNYGIFEPRTDAGFRAREQQAYHSVDCRDPGQKVVIEELPMDLVKDVPVEYQHLVCLGVVRKILYLLTKTRHSKARLSPSLKFVMNTRLACIREFTPSEFARKPRSLEELDYWKATEFRQFVLYTSPVVLKGIMSSDMYNHFMTLHVAISILVNPDSYLTYNGYARQLLENFVENFAQLYGLEHMSHNVHSLLHLSEDSRRHGPLDQFSTFPFENKYQKIKRQIKSRKNPLRQAYNRAFEAGLTELVETPESGDQIQTKLHTGKNHHCGYSHRSTAKVFKSVKFPNFELSLKNGNNCVQLSCGSIISITCIFEELGESYVLGAQFRTVNPYFTVPCTSTFIGACFVSSIGNLKLYKFQSVKRKCYTVPCDDGFFCVPIIHTTSE